MKKIWFTLLVFLGFNQQKKACAWYDPDYDYFNLFAQETITNQAYYPFLLTQSNWFYEKNDKINFQDENIEAWQKYFNNELTYSETDALLKVIRLKHLYNLKKGKLTHTLFKKLGKNFYKKYKEGFDYIIEAKYLEPYMRTSYHGEDNYYFYEDEKQKNAGDIDYEKNHKALISLYKATKNKDIKLRYAYQIVRFNHYTEHYQKAIDSFNKFVKPLKKDTPIYWYALDQMAGAERGLGLNNKANYHFFQVFMHSRNRKQSAYISMKLSNDNDFKNLLSQVENKEEQNFAYFLLAYNDFNSTLPQLKKIFNNDRHSDLPKVLVARAINNLERNYLPYTVICNDENCEKKPKRLPFYNKHWYYEKNENYINELEAFITKAKKNTHDKFYTISLAYIQFLQGKHEESNQLLNEIKTQNKLYQRQIKQMKLLNMIVAQPKITADFEAQVLKKFPTIFLTKENADYWDYDLSTEGFIKDILANRYFLQGEHGKSFLMNNPLSALQYSPNSHLVNEVEAFLNKKNKTPLEQQLVKKTKDIGDIKSFFALIHGDIAMRNAEFEKAKKYYSETQKFGGIHRLDWDYTNKKEVKRKYTTTEYDGYQNISNLVFGHNRLESFKSPEDFTMVNDYNQDFPFIKKRMNKLELVNTVLQLKNIGKKGNELSSKANQLIGNLLYNTSILGYYRHYFVMDLNNQNGPKFHFYNNEKPVYDFYYKNFGDHSSIDADNFNLAIDYYQKAFSQSDNREQKARLLFQMASAEQGKYYQWEASLPEIGWDDKDWDEKQKSREKECIIKKNQAFRTYFKKLKADYADTKTAQQLKGSCSYFEYFMR